MPSKPLFTILPLAIVCTMGASESQQLDQQLKADRERGAPVTESAEGAWPPAAFTGAADADAGPTDDVQGEVSVVLSEVAPLVDPDEADYDDALIAAVATLTSGPHQGKRIKVLTMAMRNRQLTPEMARWQNGAELQLRVGSLKAKLAAQPELERTLILDEVEDLIMVGHWADVLDP